MRRRRSKEEIMTEVLLRLANYYYLSKEEREVARMRAQHSRLVTADDFRQTLPADWQRIEKRLMNNNCELVYPRSDKAKTLQEMNHEGWVTAGHFERAPCPYGSPQAHRKRFLDQLEELIEKTRISYEGRNEPGGRQSQGACTLYRLKRDSVTARKLLKIFMALDKEPFTEKNEIRLSPLTEFMLSSYAGDLIDSATANILFKAKLVTDFIEFRLFEGRYPSEDPEWIPNILRNIDEIKAHIAASPEYERSVKRLKEIQNRPGGWQKFESEKTRRMYGDELATEFFNRERQIKKIIKTKKQAKEKKK